MRLVILSDTHGHALNKWYIPDGDVLIHCGDFCMNRKKELSQVKRLNDQLAERPHKHKILVGGNHDWPLMLETEACRELLTAVTYLQDEELVIDGVKFYGCPWQPEYRHWAFNLPRLSPELKAKWQQVPSDVDVLITHTPPYGILDRVWPERTHVGCEHLRRRLEYELKPVVHAFGHVHEARGIEQGENTLFINASNVNIDYRAVNGPVIIDLDIQARKAERVLV